MKTTPPVAAKRPPASEWPAALDGATILLAAVLVAAALLGARDVHGFVALMALGAAPALLLLRLIAAGSLARAPRGDEGGPTIPNGADAAAVLCATAAWGTGFHAVALAFAAAHAAGRCAVILAERAGRARRASGDPS